MRQYNKEDAVKQDDVDVDVSDDDDPFNAPARELVQDSEENEDEIDGNGDDSADDDVSDDSESDKEMDVRENTKNTEEVDVGDNETSSAIPRVKNVVVADVHAPDVRSPVPVEEKRAKLDNGSTAEEAASSIPPSSHPTDYDDVDADQSSERMTPTPSQEGDTMLLEYRKRKSLASRARQRMKRDK
ncbi:uncharacterized protein LOC135462212 [Liolophura sinensis]|uniref:uncharacterized protein LOC135462212 n=1 Tax=Liolophura sinensis TaxID=3198878 RepID=UPI0031589745